jgi:thiol:disulfide interchange protein DsbC
MNCPISSLRRCGIWVVVLILSACVLAAPASGASEEMPREVFKGIEQMRRLPTDGFHLVQSQGKLLLVSTNGRFAVAGGRVLDLWNNREIRSVSDVDASTRIPLARLGINASALGGLVWGRPDAKQILTVFLDPGSPETRKLLPKLRELSGRYRIDVIFVPAQTARAPLSRALICDRGAALAFLSDSRAPTPMVDRSSCGVKELDRARVTVALLGISSLPFSVAPNGATLAGAPTNYAEEIAANAGD